MKTNATLVVIVTPEDTGGTWPDFERRYGITVIRPDRVAVTLYWHWNGDGYEVQGVQASGYRVLKSGQVSDKERFTEHYSLYERANWPEFIKAAVDLAEQEARS